MDNQSTDHPSAKMWYAVGAIVLIALAAWYFYAKPSQTPVSEAVTTADLSAEFSAIPDNSVTLTQDQAASIQAVQGF